MGNQNSMFSPQENVPPEAGNIDSYEQQRVGQPRQGQESFPREEQYYSRQNNNDYSAGYGGAEAGAYWTGDQKLHPPASKVIPIWQWLLGGILLLTLASILWALINFILGSIFMVLGIAVIIIAISQLSIRTIVVPPRTFTVYKQPKLIIHNPIGSIRIHRGKTNKVEVKATKYVNGLLGSPNEGSVDIVQNGEMINVTTRSNYSWSPVGGLRNVTIDITTPEISDIQIEGNAGEIHIEGIRGQVRAGTHAGTITIQQATLSDQSLLTTNAGTITIEQTTLKGNVRFNTNAGTISFNGALDQQGSYCFTTNVGTIDIALSGNPSVTLIAATHLGTVDNAFGSTTIGPAPHARLELQTNLGTVSVRRG